MNIAEMHVWFRQYAQQMGIQNVRAILPEQIDVFINTSISDVVNQLVRDNVGVRNERVISDGSKINQINALRSLYKIVELEMDTTTPFMELLASDVNIGKMSNKYDNNGTIENVSTTIAPDYLYLVDFSINYRTTQSGYTGTHGGDAPINLILNDIVTRYFPVRLIDDAYLANTINDFILRPRINSPIIVTYNNGTFDLFIDKFRIQEYEDNNYYVLLGNYVPHKLRMSYIAKPDVVKYVSDIGGDNVDCNLPESLHVDILKHAVDLYSIAVRGGLYNSQNQQQEVNDTNSNPGAGSY